MGSNPNGRASSNNCVAESCFNASRRNPAIIRRNNSTCQSTENTSAINYAFVVGDSWLAVFEESPELKDGKVKLDGDNVVEFHKLPEFQQVTLKVLRWEERDKRLVIKEAQMVA